MPWCVMLNSMFYAVMPEVRLRGGPGCEYRLVFNGVISYCYATARILTTYAYAAKRRIIGTGKQSAMS